MIPGSAICSIKEKRRKKVIPNFVDAYSLRFSFIENSFIKILMLYNNSFIRIMFIPEYQREYDA
ncbi:MAG: hypothetical protein JWQ30_545 [Sediminibacterium sp.]|nr:hypothetical protein [Sediminibacterium sp.]